MRLTIEEVVKITNGILLQGDKNQIVETMNSDSRFDLSPNGLFIPIYGKQLNGHNFIPSAINAGAVATLVAEPVEMQEGIAYIQVRDCVDAMQEIGAYVRSQIKLPIIGITGSVGKTTTKEMIACGIEQQIKTFKTAGNANSQVGVPKMIALLDKSYDIAVLEAGMSMPGEMGRLAHIIQPNITVMTNIGVSHIESFESREGIFNEKIKLANSMKTGSPLILNGDNDILGSYTTQDYNVIHYGFGEQNDVRILDIDTAFDYTDFTALVFDQEVKVHLNAIGSHMVLNALAALTVCYVLKQEFHLNVDLRKCAEALSTYKPISGRQVIEIINNVTYIEDYYNASPDSMKASINVLSSIKCDGKRIAVVGNMNELGVNSEKYHHEIGKYLASKGIDVVISVGELGRLITQSAILANKNIEGIVCYNNNEAFDKLIPFLKKGNAVLLKASNSMNFKNIMADIKKYIAG